MSGMIFRTGLAGATALTMLVSTAQAGGFSRGEADTDILYEDGNAAFRAEGTYVSPQRGYETIGGATSSDDGYLDGYFIPSVGVMARMSDNFACAGTYTQPFGAASTYGPETQRAGYTVSAGFKTNEYGLTCSARMDLETGRVTFLGGVFLQSFDYKEVSLLGTLKLKDERELGYRIGAAYEIPEIALRGEVLYRSAVKHKGDGSFTVDGIGTGVFGAPAGTVLGAGGSGTLPQSLKISLQSGIAPGWLAFGSVKWTDWSVLPSLNYNIAGLLRRKNFQFQDGWTITGGVGHVFTDKVSGAVSLTWDRGVGTGADILTDSWTLGVGTAIQSGPGEFRVGGAVSYLTSGSQKVQGDDFAKFNATVGNDVAYGATVSYLVKF